MTHWSIFTSSRNLALLVFAAQPFFVNYGPCQAGESFFQQGNLAVVVDLSRDFRIQKDAKIYFRTANEVDPKSRTTAEQNTATRSLLATKFILAAKKQDAEYLVQVRAEKVTNFAIKDRAGKPSDSYVMFSICRIIVVDVSMDCQNTTYYSFQTRSNYELLLEGVGLWAERVQGR